jgi:Fe2+ or Zn2+ uptake regulation protein
VTVKPTRDHLDAELTERLRDRGQRVTSQRLLMHRVLRELGRHVSAEEILERTSPQLPNLSLPTVYATLDLLEELGIVRRVSAGPGPVLFDPRTEDDHQHFVCRSCGRVYDLETKVDVRGATRQAKGSGHQPDHADVVITGLCRHCA